MGLDKCSGLWAQNRVMGLEQNSWFKSGFKTGSWVQSIGLGSDRGSGYWVQVRVLGLGQGSSPQKMILEHC